LTEDGIYNLFSILAKTGALYEKGVITGAVSDGIITPTPINNTPTAD